MLFIDHHQHHHHHYHHHHHHHQSAAGPGTVLVFPWLDRFQSVDVGDAAFSVPPQQLITHDGGIIEIGREQLAKNGQQFRVGMNYFSDLVCSF